MKTESENLGMESTNYTWLLLGAGPGLFAGFLATQPNEILLLPEAVTEGLITSTVLRLRALPNSARIAQAMTRAFLRETRPVRLKLLIERTATSGVCGINLSPSRIVDVTGVRTSSVGLRTTDAKRRKESGSLDKPVAKLVPNTQPLRTSHRVYR